MPVPERHKLQHALPFLYFFLSQHGCDKKKKIVPLQKFFLNSIKIKSNLPNIFSQKRVKVKTNRKKNALASL